MMIRSNPNRRNRQSTIGNRPSRGARRALTIIELLVVISIIAILISVVTVASSALIGKSRANNTRGLLEVVNTAVHQFKAERPAALNARKTTAAGPVSYLQRYGPYPPDELEVFADTQNPISSASIAPGKAVAMPKPAYPPMRFFAGTEEETAREHRDLAAMIVAIEVLTQEAAAILEKVPDRNRVAGPLDSSTPPKPLQFLDRSSSTAGPDGNWGADDLQVRYIVDDWGVPLGYLAQRDWTKANASVTDSKNLPDYWNQASTQLIRLNGGEPVIFSWGADGKEQLTRDVMDSTTPKALASLVVDFVDDTSAQPGVVDHSMNADNIYLDPAFAEKISGQQ